MSSLKEMVRLAGERLAFLVVMGVGFSSLPTFGADATVTVNPQTTYQTIEGFGDVHDAEAFRDPAKSRSISWTGVDDCMIRDLPYAVMDMGINLSWWEPSKGTYNNVQGIPEYIGKYKNCRWIFYVGQTASWMNSDDIINSIGQMIVKVKNSVNYMVPYVSYGGANPAWVKKAGEKFSALGLTTKVVVGEDRNANGAASYLEPFLSDTAIQKYLGPIAYTVGEYPNITHLNSIGALVTKYKKPVWNTRDNIWLSYNADTDPDGEFAQVSTWTYTWMIVDIYFKSLKYAHAATCLHRDWGKPLFIDPWNCSSIKLPTYFVIHQFATTFPVGSQVLDASSSDGAVWSLASSKSGYFSVLLVNSGTSSKTVDVNGVPNGTYSVVLTDSTHKMSSLANQAATANKLSVTISPRSMTTISTSAASPVFQKSEIINSEEQLQCIQNSSGQTIGFRFGGKGIKDVSIFKTNGSLVTTLHGNGMSQTMFGEKQLSGGVYIAKAKINNHLVTTSFVK